MKEGDYWEDSLDDSNNIKMDLHEIGWVGIGWINVGQNRVPTVDSREHNNEF
jgi:hypothetical protein